MKVRTVLMRRALELSKKYKIAEAVVNPETKEVDVKFESKVTIRLNETEYARFQDQVKKPAEAL